MSSDEDIAVPVPGPAAEAEPEDSDGDIAVALVPGVAAGAHDDVCVRRVPPTSGSLGACIVGQPTELERRPFARREVVGLADIQWNLQPPQEAAAVENACPVASRTEGGDGSWGVCTYSVMQVWKLEARVGLDTDAPLEGEEGNMAVRAACEQDHASVAGRGVREALPEMPHPPFAVMVLAMWAALGCFVPPLPTVVRVVRLGVRKALGLVPQFPSGYCLRHFRAQTGPRPRGPVAGPQTETEWKTKYENILLRLPANHDKQTRVGATHGKAIDREHGTHDVDPIRLLEGLDFAQYLRSPKYLSDAMCASTRFDAPQGPRRDSAADPGATSFERVAQKLDVVDMLLERRAWEADRATDNVQAVNLYSDSSPVTGEELQGMVADIMRRMGEPRRIVLPGASLFYGNYSALAKGVTLLWACYLIAGPFFPHMEYFLSKVTSITTDFGVEIKTLEMPGILKAFFSLACRHEPVRHGGIDIS